MMLSGLLALFCACILVAYAWELKQSIDPVECVSCAQKNFGRPVEWALVKDHPWSTPQLRKLDTPVRCQSIAVM